MLATELMEDRLVSSMGLVALIPSGASTTLRGKEGRIIDFLLISRDIAHIIVNLTVDVTTSCVHHGISFDIITRPRSLGGS